MIDIPFNTQYEELPGLIKKSRYPSYMNEWNAAALGEDIHRAHGIVSSKKGRLFNIRAKFDKNLVLVTPYNHQNEVQFADLRPDQSVSVYGNGICAAWENRFFGRTNAYRKNRAIVRLSRIVKPDIKGSIYYSQNFNDAFKFYCSYLRGLLMVGTKDLSAHDIMHRGEVFRYINEIGENGCPPLMATSRIET